MQNFGLLSNGQKANLYTLSNEFIDLVLTDYGATIVSIILKTKNGKIDVALGYNSAREYQDSLVYRGATVGRVANRIAGAKFTMDNIEYKLTENVKDNHLHGGISGFTFKMFTAFVSGQSATFKYTSKDGEEGYPGNLDVAVTFKLSGASVEIEYNASADKKTPVNLTNHTYFNLNGQSSGDILGHTLTINSSVITPLNDKLITQGTFLDITGTEYDFTSPKAIGKDILSNNPMLTSAQGYDVNYVLSGNYVHAATVVGDKSQVVMDVYTQEKGVQLYCANTLDVIGKGGKRYGKYSAFCLETQSSPNAVNYPKEYGNIFLEKGKEYKTKTVYKFSF